MKKNYSYISRIGLAVMLFITSLTVSAQSAMSVLDRAAKTFTSAGGIRANFTFHNYSSGKSSGGASGTIYISGNKYKVVVPQMTTWFNGKTQWAYVKANNEVNVSNPSTSEQLNPYTFVHLYKSGYKAAFGKTTKSAGRPVYEIHLTATGRKPISEAWLTIDRETYVPLCIRVRQNSRNWMAIYLRGFKTRQNYNASFFQFNPKHYPKAEVIDLR